MLNTSFQHFYQLNYFVGEGYIFEGNSTPQYTVYPKSMTVVPDKYTCSL